MDRAVLDSACDIGDVVADIGRAKEESAIDEAVAPIIELLRYRKPIGRGFILRCGKHAPGERERQKYDADGGIWTHDHRQSKAAEESRLHSLNTPTRRISRYTAT